LTNKGAKGGLGLSKKWKNNQNETKILSDRGDSVKFNAEKFPYHYARASWIRRSDEIRGAHGESVKFLQESGKNKSKIFL